MTHSHQTADHCYLHLEQFSLRYLYYAIIDTADYYADQLFIRHQVTVHFGKEFAHPESTYLIIMCKVRKKDKRRFLDALEELPNKMLLCGHPDYPAFCEQFYEKMERSRAKLRSGKDNHEGKDRAPVNADQETAAGAQCGKARLVERRKPCNACRARQEGV